jgi:hypothetical protein
LIHAVQARDYSALANIDVKVLATLKIDYFNIGLDLWEPLVERWEVRCVRVCV